MNKGPKNGKNWDSRKKAVVGTPLYENTKSYGVIEFESAGKAAEWIIENALSGSTLKSTVASSITSTVKGRECRTHANKSGLASRNEAYGFAWAYKD